MGNLNVFTVKSDEYGEWTGTQYGGTQSLSVKHAQAVLTEPNSKGNPTAGTGYIIPAAKYDAYIAAKDAPADTGQRAKALLAFARENALSVVQTSAPYVSSSLQTTQGNNNAPSFAIGITKDGRLYKGGPQTPDMSMSLIESQSRPNGNEGRYFVVLEKDMEAVQKAMNKATADGKHDLKAIRQACEKVAVGTATAHPATVKIENRGPTPALYASKQEIHSTERPEGERKPKGFADKATKREIEIKKGDTLSGFAKQLGLGSEGVAMLRQSIEGCQDACKIQVGQKIDMDKLARLREKRNGKDEPATTTPKPG